MKTLQKGALCAAVILCTSSANAASTFYLFHTTGSGTVIGARGDPDPYTPRSLTDLVFSFAIDDAQTIVRASDGSSVALGNPVGEFAGAFTSGLNFSVNRGGDITASFRGCFDNAGATFPVSTTVVMTTCASPTSINASGINGLLAYSGQTTLVEVLRSSSSASGYQGFVSSIPEPATWALMLAGFGLVGYAMRHRRPQIAYA